MGDCGVWLEFASSPEMTLYDDVRPGTLLNYNTTQQSSSSRRRRRRQGEQERMKEGTKDVYSIVDSTSSFFFFLHTPSLGYDEMRRVSICCFIYYTVCSTALEQQQHERGSFN